MYTKKQLTIFLFFILVLFLPSFVYAYPGQSSLDPLYIEIHESQRSENQIKINNFISQYGATIYGKCYQSYCAKGDMSSPYAQAMCLAGLTDCLQRESSFSKYREQSNTINSDPDRGCKDKYGLYAYLKETNSSEYICDCLTNYKWNENKTACVSSNLDFDAICKKDYKQNAYYIGKMTEKNEAICGCLPGYIWQGRSCVSIEEKDQVCKINVFYFPAAPQTVVDARRMYGPQKEEGCVCPENYSWQKNMCVINQDILKNNSGNESAINSQPQSKVLGESDKKDSQKILKQKTLASTIASLSVRKSPSVKAKVVWSIKKGKSYSIIGAQGDWYQIKISNKLSGWVMKKYVKTKK